MEEPYGAPEGSGLPPSKYGAGYTTGDGATEPAPPAYGNQVRYPPPGLEPPEDYQANRVRYPPPGLEPPEDYQANRVRYPNAAPPPPAPGAAGYPPYPPVPGQYPMVMAPVGYAPANRTNAMAIAALVSSLVLAPLGVIFGHIALSQIKKTGEEGRGLAIAGLVIGYVFTVVAALWVIAYVVFFIWLAAAVNDYDSDYDYSYSMAAPVSAVVD